MKGKGVESFSFVPVKSFWAGDQGVNLEYIQGVEKQIRQKDRDYQGNKSFLSGLVRSGFSWLSPRRRPENYPERIM